MDRSGWARLTNHAPMVVEALAAHGQAGAVHRWLDLYRGKLEDFPTPVAPVTDDNWPSALGDPRRAADWIEHFSRALADHPWHDVLALWWPRLLPGDLRRRHPSGHPGRPRRSAPSKRHRTSPGSPNSRTDWATGRPGTTPRPGSSRSPAPAPRRGRWTRHPPSRRPRAASRPGSQPYAVCRSGRTTLTDPDTARERLTELVRAATHRYATHGHGEATMLVHAATAPNAVLRTLGSLPREMWVPSLRAAWTASAAVTAMYAPAQPVTYTPPARLTAEEVLERALAHGDEHVIKLTDTALDVGDEQALAAALRSVERSAPLA